MASTNVEQMRRGYEAFNRGDFEQVVAQVDPEVGARERADSPDPREFHGRTQMLEALEALKEEFDDYRMEPVEFIEEEDYLIVVIRQSGRGRLSGVPVEGDLAHLWRLRDGRAVSLRAFSTKQEALEAAEAA
jgi:ketosteroid isomerase-like protein